SAAEGQVAGQDPEEQREDQDEDGDPGPALPAPGAPAGLRRLGAGAAVLAAAVSVRGSFARGPRNCGDLPLDPAAAIDAIRLLLARSRHLAGYGTQPWQTPGASWGSTWAGRRSSLGSSMRRARSSTGESG